MGKKNIPTLPDIATIMKAGINPKTGWPMKMGLDSSENLSPAILTALRILDEQDAVNRGTWYNLPNGITSYELERMLYYKGQLAFFYFKDLDKFYFMPYALDGTIDFYGRFNTIHPVPFANGKEEEDTKRYKEQLSILSQLKLKCIYEPILDENEITEELLTKSCVLLHDYSKQLSQNIIPRKNIQEPILKVMSEIIPMMRTALLASSGISGVKVQDADEENSIETANSQIYDAAMSGEFWIPITGKVDFQELTGQQGKNASQDYLLTLQSLDNFRLSLYGIDNGGLFEKKAQELNAEAALNGGPVGLVQEDKTRICQNFCNIVNSIWGLGIWYEPSETTTQVDINGDGIPYDRDVPITESTGGTENE